MLLYAILAVVIIGIFTAKACVKHSGPDHCLAVLRKNEVCRLGLPGFVFVNPFLERAYALRISEVPQSWLKSLQPTNSEMMATLIESRRKAEGYLWDACSSIMQDGEAIWPDDVCDIETRLRRGELTSAVVSLENLYTKGGFENHRGLELMLLASETLHLHRHASRYRAMIARARGD